MTDTIILILVIAILLFERVWSQKQHHEERRELYSRIMARDLDDYSKTEQTTAPPKGRNFVLAGIDRSIKRMEEGRAE